MSTLWLYHGVHYGIIYSLHAHFSTFPDTIAIAPNGDDDNSDDENFDPKLTFNASSGSLSGMKGDGDIMSEVEHKALQRELDERNTQRDELLLRIKVSGIE